MIFSPSKKLLFGCLAFLGGVAWFELTNFENNWLMIGGIVALLLLFLLKRWFVLVLIMFFIIGNFWTSRFQPLISSEHIVFYHDQTKAFPAAITDEPDNRLASQYLLVQPRSYQGKVLIKTNVYPEYRYGDLLGINCQLQSPPMFENFRYDDYLARFGVYTICSWPEIKLLGRDQGNFLLEKIFQFKNYALVKINQTLSEPAAALLAGILLGERSGLPNTLSQQFQTVGLSHIIVVSGFNLTIIAFILSNLAPYVYLNRRQTFWVILCFLSLFVILTGATASVVRAAIMVGLVMLAHYLGRVSRPQNILVLAATVMVAINPKILFGDLGFQLSFLSMAGLIFFSPTLQTKLSWLPERFALRENIVSTMAAILATLPLILFNFQRLSLLSPLVNVLVLPVIPVVMLLGLWQFIGAAVSLFFGQIIGWFNWLFLHYVIRLAEFFSTLPGAAVHIKIDWWLMLLIYFLFWLFFVQRRPRSVALSG